MNRQRFLEGWFTDCVGKVELRALPIKGSDDCVFYKPQSFSGINAFCAKKQNKDIYFGTATRNGQGGTKANIIDIPGVWTEIDFPIKTKPGRGIPKEEADKLLKECPLPPTLIVSSGNGYHVYFRFREPTDNLGIVEHVNQQLRAYFGGNQLDNVSNADRILRLPDTLNRKYNPPRPVKVVQFNEHAFYNESDFEEHFPPVEDTGQTGHSNNTPGWQEEALKGVSEGSRNTTATQLAGREIRKGRSPQETLTYLRGCNLQNRPPLDDGELKGIVESVYKTHDRNHPVQEDSLQFPDIMDGVAGEFARIYSKYLEIPPHFLFMAFLTCLGSAVAKTVELETELDLQPRLYLLLLGESADERKSTALKKTISFFKETLTEFPVCWGVGSAEGLQKVTKDDIPVLLCFDEFKQFLSKCRIEHSTLLPMVTTLFESNTYETHTQKSDIKLENAYLSLLAASTSETHETIWDSSFTAIGFNNRLWIVPGKGERKFSFPESIPEKERGKVERGLVEVLKFVGENLKLDLTPEAKELFHHWYMNVETSIHTKRLDTYALRFMALFAVNEQKNEVDVEIAKKAIELCYWQLKVRQLYDPIDADNTIAEMEERVRRYLKDGPLTERELKRNLHRIIGKTGVWCFTTAIKNLKIAKEIYFKNVDKTVLIYLVD